MAAPISGTPVGPGALAHRENGRWAVEPPGRRVAAGPADLTCAAAALPRHSPGPHLGILEPEPNPGPARGGGPPQHTSPAGAVRMAALRALIVATLALAGLLVFGLLPGGRDAPTVVPHQYPLPPAPTMHAAHPHGPNRP
jgi:hypothetical protein